MITQLSRWTRFRAYQLGEIGSSFSYFDGTTFTLIEARVTDLNRPRLISELAFCGQDRVGCLHITSWDNDHCGKADLEEILDTWVPRRIEYPGYAPDSDTGKECLDLIRTYKRQQIAAIIQKIDPPYIQSLGTAVNLGYRDVFYHPKYFSENHNDNSTIKLFRTGCFNMASLGDVESSDISSWLRRCRIFNSEVDVLILAHHGADNGFTSQRFLREVRPTVAVCSSNYDNQFDHPDGNIRELLDKFRIPIYTTKTGDIVVRSLHPHTKQFQVINLKADSEEISSARTFTTKKSTKLSHNADTVRQNYAGRPAYRMWSRR